MTGKPQHLRVHRIELDVHAWAQDGRDYTATLTIDESKLADLVGRAIRHHTHTTKAANGVLTVSVKPIAPTTEGATE